MSDTTYKKFVARWEEVIDLPIQRIGPLTPYYKSVTKRLKIMPWPLLVGMSLMVIVGLYLLIGSTVTLLVTLLQKGF